MPPPPESDSAGSTQQINSLTFMTNVPPPGRLELKRNLSSLGEMEASLGHLRNRHKTKRKGK